MLEIQKSEGVVPRFDALEVHELDALASEAGLRGYVHAVCRNGDGEIAQELLLENLITLIGDQYYGERASGIASPPAQVTGMRLGTGVTAPAKTGTGAASIGIYIAGSAVAIAAGFPTSSIPGTARRITWKSTWAAGVATNAAISEAVVTNETPLTDVIGAAANTISRVVLSPTINKGASDTLDLTWHHDLLGA